MQCKIFSVPVANGAVTDREQTLNGFLGMANVKHVFASLATQPEGPMWSILLLYEDGMQTAPDKHYEANREVRTEVPPPEAAGREETSESPGPLTSEQVKSIIALKKWRADQAAQEGVPLYMVAQNRWLEDLVRMPGRTLDDLMKVKGLGGWRVQKYGTKILEVLKSATSTRRSWPAPYGAGRA
jgi:superfamily II DNA helicase RecQ